MKYHTELLADLKTAISQLDANSIDNTLKHFKELANSDQRVAQLVRELRANVSGLLPYLAPEGRGADVAENEITTEDVIVIIIIILFSEAAKEKRNCFC